MSNLLKTLNKNGSGGEKFNPDISNLYNNANQIRQTTNFQFSTEGYKTIMNEKITKPIKSQDDLKVEYKKVDQKEMPMVLKKIQELENERLNEKQKLTAQIDHSKKLEELIKIKRKEATDNYQATTHGELKQIQINQNDKIKKEKERYNDIVNSLNDILK
jgi:hypothetical protein